MTHSRREFLRVGTLCGAGLAVSSHAARAAPPLTGRASPQVSDSPRDPWAEADAIAQRVTPPHIPARDFDVRKFGARADGEFDCTRAFASAIDACRASGGGRIVVPAASRPAPSVSPAA